MPIKIHIFDNWMSLFSGDLSSKLARMLFWTNKTSVTDVTFDNNFSYFFLLLFHLVFQRNTSEDNSVIMPHV